MNNLPSYLRSVSDGHVQDLRLKYHPGTRIRITEGLCQGQDGMIDSLLGAFYWDENWTEPPGYNVKLDDGHWITVRWDLVEEVGQ